MNTKLFATVIVVGLLSGCAGMRVAPNSEVFNVDFGVWKPSLSTQVGPAAVGKRGDFWNVVGVPFNSDHAEDGLKWANGQSSPINLRMINLGGGWGNSGGMGIKDPMMDSFNYPQNNQGGDSHIILSNVPAGTYYLYLYGHGTSPGYYGDYTVTVGGQNYGRKLTSNQTTAITNTSYVEGSQYVKFSKLFVKNGDSIEILIQPGGLVSDDSVRHFTDAMINGLQLVPEREMAISNPIYGVP